MSIIERFTIASDYGCLALVNRNIFTSFINENWQLEDLVHHFVTEINKNHMVAWGCVSGNWKIEIHDRISDISGYQESYQNIFSDGKLLLVNYDSLTYAAQFSDTKLPLEGMEDFQLEIYPGHYLCRVIQLFDSCEAESEEVFYQDSPHFIIELEKNKANVEPHDKIPWFPLSE